MKLINSLTYGIYNKEVFKLSKKLLIYSLFIFIIGFLIILFKLSFICRTNYIIEKSSNNLYHVIIPYEDLCIWQDSTTINFNNKTYEYKIIELLDETIFQNTKVYLQLKIEIENFSNSIPILEISLENKSITLLDYLNNKFRGK